MVRLAAWLGTAGLAFFSSAVRAAEPPAETSTEESSPGLVDPNSTLTSSTYDAVFTDVLPLIGHAWQDTLVLAPGVSDLDGDGNPVVHGSRENSVYFALDGADTTDPATGGWGVNLDPLAIDSVTLITAGAPAEYGRAMGGFSDIITRSGSNDFAGRLWILWRGDFLDGGGADNEDFLPFEEETLSWNDLKLAVSAGGAIVRDKLWYFATLETLDTEHPTERIGPDTLIESHGYFGLGKLTWQADAANRLDLQVNAYPLEINGLGTTAFSTPDSGFDQEQGGVTAQIRWAGLFSPTLMFDAALAHFDTDLSVTPTSDDFDPKELAVSGSFFDAFAVTASYPCATFNCFFDDDISRIDRLGQVSGPYPYLIDRDVRRDTLSGSLTFDIDDHGGDHRLRFGFEAGKERLHEELMSNLVLIDLTTPFFGTGVINPLAVSGVQIVQAPQPTHLDGTVNNFFMGAWLSDAWKVLPGLSINAGIRYDSDDLDAPGYRGFDPREERIDSIGLWEAVCAEARRQSFVPTGSNCFSAQTYDANPPELPSGVIQSYEDANMDGINDVPAEVAALDIDQNGTIDFEGSEAIALYQHFTRRSSRNVERFAIEESDISPRLGVSWDPWNDGKTRAFAHWGRYHDRLRLETALMESGPDYLSFSFVPNSTTHLISPGAPSAGSTLPSISQLDHDLETPYTDEWSLGFERELGVAWSAGLTFVSRSAENLLYERDLNHYTCAQAGEAIDFDPFAICGDVTELDSDRFGDLVFFGFPPVAFARPNGLEDLYAASPAFNQVLTVNNSSAAEYTAWELKVVRALQRSWQMQMSYTLSHSRGTITSVVTGDPSLSGAETGSLDFDQRHAFKVQAAAHLPHGIALGGIITWASGTPYSIFETTADLDSETSTQARRILPTGGLNDQRNDVAWRLDGRIEKSFTIGRTSAGAFLLVENILNDDDLVIESASPNATTLIGTRDFGRRFEIGALFTF